jgi:hypothetical protein
MLILNFNHPLYSYFSFLAKAVLLKVVSPLKIYQCTEFDGPTLTGENFVKFENLPFGMVAAMTIKILASSSLSMA